jgi:nickel-dependent lactate racemase
MRKTRSERKTLKVEFPYGKGDLVLDVPGEKLVGVYEPREMSGVPDLRAEVERALGAPVNSKRLREVARGRRTAAIVVDDVSRSVPNAELLPPIIGELRAAGLAMTDITVVVATGLHRPLTESERDATRGELPVRIVNHHADRERELVSIGTTALGQEIKVNRSYMSADLKVLVGDVEYHQFCGYGGGAKSVYPGIADAKAIRHNHSMMESEGAGPGRWEGNPVRQEIEEVGRMAGVDFLLSVVMNSGKEVVRADSGHVVDAFLAGTRVVDEMYRIAVPEAVDLVIASAGGDPKDINLYQAQKAVAAARRIVRRGGAIAVIAKCPEGHGSELFDRWMNEATSLQDIVERLREKFVMGGHKAYQFAREISWADVSLLSALPPGQVRAYFMTPLGGARDLMELVGRARTVAALPQATLTLAELAGGSA